MQAAQQEQAAVEDSNSRVTFEVEVVHFQAYLQAEMAPGRFLLAAEKGMVQGRSMPHLFQSLITLTLDQVSTYLIMSWKAYCHYHPHHHHHHHHHRYHYRYRCHCHYHYHYHQ